MDPWQPCSVNNPTGDDDDISSNTSNVVGLALHNGDTNEVFVKLSDSQQYLESLERKLTSIQKGGHKGANADSILRSLGQSKESCMIKLLSNSVEKLTVEGEIFEELKVNPLLKKIAPERQALTAEELVHLLKADQLDFLTGSEKVAPAEETEKDKDSTEETTESSESHQ